MTRSSDNSDDHDPWLEALRNAPVGIPFTPEQRAELDQAVADLAAGRVKLIPHEEVHAWLEARIREEAELAADEEAELAAE